MLTGHYAPAFLIKTLQPRLPLWLLFMAVQLVDVAWCLLILGHVEKVHIIPGFTASNPLDLYYMPYSHSLLAVLLWAVGALLVYRFIPRLRSWVLAGWMAAAVLSHWLLDLVVHVPDLPLIGNSHKVGFGLWNHAAAALMLELGLLCAAAWCMAARLPRHGNAGHPARRRIVALCLALVGVQLYSLLGPIPATQQALTLTMLAVYAACAALAWWAERALPYDGCMTPQALPARRSKLL